MRQSNTGYGPRSRRGLSVGALRSAHGSAHGLVPRAERSVHAVGDARRVLETALQQPQRSTEVDAGVQRRVHEALAALRDVEITQQQPSEDRALDELMAPIPDFAGPGTANVSRFREIIFTKPGSAVDGSDAHVSKARRPARGLAELLADSPRLPDSCAICLGDFAHGDKLRVLPCDGAHAFHERCLKLWLVRNPSCPMCREDVRPGPVELDPEIARRVLEERTMRNRRRPRRGLSVDA